MKPVTSDFKYKRVTRMTALTDGTHASANEGMMNDPARDKSQPQRTKTSSVIFPKNGRITFSRL